MFAGIKLKVLLLGILLSGLWSGAFAYPPLYFTHIDRNNSDAQLAEWNYLMKYKIYGRTGIEFLGRDIVIPDKVGWFGTSNGDWTMQNDEHRVGGPIIIGGNVSFQDGKDSILTGPMRVTGNVKVGNFNSTNTTAGNICISGNVASEFVKIVNVENRYFTPGKGYNNCPTSGPDSVPQVKTNLTIPVVDNDDLPPYQDDRSMFFDKYGGSNGIPNGSIYVNDMTGYIDVPKSDKLTEEEQEEDFYDLHVRDFHLLNRSELVVRMPSGGRMTRIFIDETFEISAHPKIKVVYMDDNAVYDEESHRWVSGNMNAIQNDKYMGNLLFYAKRDMVWPALNQVDSIQGTFISQGTIHIKQQMTLAGQLLANKIKIDANFDGSGFIFVPFKPSKIDPDALAEGEYLENNQRETIDIKLDRAPSTDVTFDYCYHLGDGAGFASRDDFVDNSPDMLWCKEDKKGSVRIYAGETTPKGENNAWVQIKKDGVVEGDEWFYICISNLNGAVIKGNYDTQKGLGVCLPLKIKDAENPAPIINDKDDLKVTEHVKGDFAGKIIATDDGLITYSIEGGDGKDLFVIDQNGNLSLKADSSVDYEKKSFYYVQVGASDNQSMSTKTFKVNVIDVNERPIANDKTFKIKENYPAGHFAYYDWDDFDKASKFRDNNISVAVEGEGSDTDLFEITSDGDLKVKNNAVLDYEVTRVHHLKVKVYDTTDESLYDEATITIELIDEDDGPKIDIPPEYPENDPKKHILVLRNGDEQGVKENNAKDALAGTVKATCTALNCIDNMTFTMYQDTSGLFEMNPKTGEITVKDSMVLDYEKVNEYMVRVYVCDNNPAGEQYHLYDSATVIIKVIDVNEKPLLDDGTLVVVEHKPIGTEVAHLDTLTSDLDTAKKFTQHSYRGIGGDTLVFNVNANGVITTRTILSYAKDSTYAIVVEVIDKENPSLKDTATMSIKVENVNDNPYFTSDDKYKFPENPKNGYVIGTLTADDKDLDDFEFTFKLKSKINYVSVSEDGIMTVKDSTVFDFEKTHKLSFEVTVFDAHGGSSDTLITITITDVNELVTLPPQTFVVREDSDTGVVIGKLVANDLDTAQEFTHKTFKLLERSVGFRVDSNGVITLLDSLDYETDSIYVLKVSVTDGEFCDTNDIVIKVQDVPEWSKVVITRGETLDSVWLYPDTIFTNRATIDLEWEEDGKTRYGTETLKNGKNVIIKTFKDPNKNYPGADTVIIYYDSSSPEVIVSTKVKDVVANNIYTVVQAKDDKDSAYYVNSDKNDIFVSVKDPVSSKVDTFTMNVKLDSLYITPSTFTKTMKTISDAKIALDRNLTTEKTTTQLNGDVYATTYKEMVNGNEVLVTYYTDYDGELVKGESGKKEIKVSYTLKVDGKTVITSFRADAATGALIEERNGALYTVSYDYVDKQGNSVNVAYGVDADGSFVKNEEGNAGYEVSYSYTNKYGNTSTKSVYIVVDKVGPKVAILSPLDGDVIHSNFVDVKWTVDGVVQDTLVTQGLQKGTFPIVRYYRDKAGNTDSAVIIVIVKNAKDVEISIEKPVTDVNEERVAEYYGINPPKNGETFAVSLYNVRENAEDEVLIGGNMKTKPGSGEEPYPGMKGHLGPTLTIDAKLPTVNEVRGLATLDDLVNSDGLVAVDGVDAKDSKKLPVEKYVKEYCSDEFVKTLPSDISKANLFNTKLGVDVWIYTNLGVYVDKISFSMDLNDPDYINDAGRLSLFMELKPDMNGYVHTKDGSLLATGAYVFKTDVNMQSTLRCSIPPVSDKGNKASKLGAKRKVSEELLKPFGYRRPDSK